MSLFFIILPDFFKELIIQTDLKIETVAASYAQDFNRLVTSRQLLNNLFVNPWIDVVGGTVDTSQYHTLLEKIPDKTNV